jgi:hypothetical protein
LTAANNLAVRWALESAGAEFTNGDQPSVRLTRDRCSTLRAKARQGDCDHPPAGHAAAVERTGGVGIRLGAAFAGPSRLGTGQPALVDALGNG